MACNFPYKYIGMKGGGKYTRDARKCVKGRAEV